MQDYTDFIFFFFFQAEDGIRDYKVTGVQTCALPIYVEVEEQRRRPAGPDRQVRRRHRALLRHLRLAADQHAGVERRGRRGLVPLPAPAVGLRRSEEHTSELQSPCNLVCRLLLEKKKQERKTTHA